MGSLVDIEAQAWAEINKATAAMDAGRISHFSSIAREIEERKRDWEARMAACPSVQTSATLSPQPPASPSANGARRRGHRQASTNYTGQQIRGFDFDGTPVNVTTYKALLLELATILRRKHSGTFDAKVLTFGGRKRRYFSLNSGNLKYAHELQPGGLYVETNLNANLIVDICFDMVRALGYDETRLRVY